MGAQSWFDEARFGMFVHWSAISLRGFELSWPLVGGIPLLPYGTDVDVGDYYSRALEFSPEPGAAKRWTELAARAGMRYAVLTTKHHDGFALWPTRQTDFSIAQTPYKGDLVGEYVEACRSAGLRVGMYYSLSDWHHPDYPAFRQEDKPYPVFLGRRSQTWDRYLDAMFGQIRELLTDYGTVDLLWFDGQWERTAEEWKADELVAMIRGLQPDILINDRLPAAADFRTPEQSVPPTAPDGRWETCMTMNRTWGWCPGDQEYKSVAQLVRTLCETASKGGNLLLNVSPMGDGGLPSEQVERIESVAGWMDANGDAIHATQPGLEPWQFDGPSTRRGETIYLHQLASPFGTVHVRGVPIRRVDSVRHLASGRELAFRGHATAEEEISSRDPIGEIVIDVPGGLVEAPGAVLELRLH